MSATSSGFGAKRPLARAVGGYILFIAGRFVGCARAAFGDSSGRCSPRLSLAINAKKEWPAGAKSSGVYAKRPLSRAVGGYSIIVARSLIEYTRVAYGDGL